MKSSPDVILPFAVTVAQACQKVMDQTSMILYPPLRGFGDLVEPIFPRWEIDPAPHQGKPCVTVRYHDRQGRWSSVAWCRRYIDEAQADQLAAVISSAIDEVADIIINHPEIWPLS